MKSEYSMAQLIAMARQQHVLLQRFTDDQVAQMISRSLIQLKDSLSSHRDPTAPVYRLIQEGEHLLHDLGRLDEAEKRFEEAMKVALDTRNVLALWGTYENLGILYSTRSNLAQALIFYNKARGLAEDIGAPQLIGTISNDSGVAYRNQGRLDKAIEHFNEAIAHAEAHKDHGLLFAAYNNLGQALAAAGRLEDALDAYNKGLDSASTDIGAEENAEIYLNVGLLQLRRNRADLAKTAFVEGIARANNKGRLGRLRLGLSVSYAQTGDGEDAGRLCHQALPDLMEAQDYYNAANAHVAIGNHFIRKKEWSGARLHFSKAGELFDKVGAEEEVRRVQSHLSRLPE